MRSDSLETKPILRLLVRNHPGVMSHVCGLFARRAFNVEAILCLPLASGAQSVIFLEVHEDARLEQVIRQLRKLEDVLDVSHAATPTIFSALRSNPALTAIGRTESL